MSKASSNQNQRELLNELWITLFSVFIEINFGLILKKLGSSSNKVLFDLFEIINIQAEAIYLSNYMLKLTRTLAIYKKSK